MSKSTDQEIRNSVLTELRSLYREEGPDWFESTEDLHLGQDCSKARLINVLEILCTEGKVQKIQKRKRNMWAAVPAQVKIIW